METNAANESVRTQLIYDANKKSTGTAYLLWFFLGAVGAHRFYLGYTGSAVAMLLLWLFSLVTLIIGVGLLVLLGIFIWWIVDAFLISDMVRRINMNVADQLTRGHQ